MRREPLETVINMSVNQTLSRTVMTSGLTFLTVISLFSVRRPGAARLFVCAGVRYYCRDVFFGFRCQPDRAVLAQFRGQHGRRAPAAVAAAGAGCAPEAARQPPAASPTQGGQVAKSWPRAAKAATRKQGKEADMFEQTFVDGVGKTNKTWTVFVSFVVQIVVGRSSLVIIPLIYSDALPKSAADQFPGGASASAAASSASAARSAVKVVKVIPRQFDAGKLMAPKAVPKEIAMIQEDELPPPSAARRGRRRSGGVRRGRRRARRHPRRRSLAPPPPPPPPVEGREARGAAAASASAATCRRPT